jgi:threonyl-tRNA synthetase
VPAILVVGKREADDGTVTVRRLGSKDQEILALDDAVSHLIAEAVSPAAK